MDRLMFRPARTRPSIIAHVDLNSFFASVEQQANPLLRGKPVGVCSYLHRRGCVIAASVEAKKLGMKVGMNMEEAAKTVPGSMFVQNDPPKYRTVGGQVFELFGQLTDTWERYSIDEAFLDLTGWYHNADDAARALQDARLRMKRDVGEWLDVSVGIAETRFLAKTGSDFKKPGGMTIITQENLDHILSQLDLEDVCGVGPRTRRCLERLGYHTLLEVKRAPIANLIRAFGRRGYFLWSQLNGVEVEGVADEVAPPKSIGHSYCVPQAANREGKIEGILAKLTDRAARRLRKEGMLTNAVSLSVGFRGPGFASPQGPFWTPLSGQGGGGWKRLDEPLDDGFTLIETATSLLRDSWHGESVNFLAVTLYELSEPNDQMRLEFGGSTSRRSEPVMQRRKRVSDAMDQVRNRHGDTSLQFGRQFQVGEDDAPDRIGFRKL